MAAPEPTVFIVDDDAEVRRSLTWLIESVNLQARSFTSAAAFLDAYQSDQPGCLLLDLRMPKMGGLKLQAELARRQVTLPIIVVSAYADVADTVRAMRAGAATVVKKPYADQVLLEHVQEAIRTDAKRRRRRAQRDLIDGRIAELTPRQRQIMKLVVAGHGSKQIAFQLGISTKTVEYHRSRIMAGMRADCVATLVRIVLTRAVPRRPVPSGLVSPVDDAVIWVH